MIEALERFRSTRVPLTAANFVLSLALFLGAARTIGRRPGGIGWLRQVCVASFLFVGVEHVASRAERAFLAEKIPPLQAERLQSPTMSKEQAEAAVRTSLRLAQMLKVLAQLGLYGGLAIALGRRSVDLELSPADRAGGLPPARPGDRDR
jgi:hypothetical protein